MELVTSPPPPPSVLANHPNMDEGLHQAMSSVDLEAPIRLGVGERSRLLLEVQRQLLNVVLLSSVLVNGEDLLFEVSIEEVNSLRAMI
ncbi:hypothetical protein A2U01_0055766 [Trifolium medium]|uniref:Uncharacterized protein n=1 Tax=Trifolium medium TaxID=97028 RepID=A0A392RFD7_9FABA|nr:hypothetical protein [Trifolium medium]